MLSPNSRKRRRTAKSTGCSQRFRRQKVAHVLEFTMNLASCIMTRQRSQCVPHHIGSSIPGKVSPAHEEQARYPILFTPADSLRCTVKKGKAEDREI